ncbi:hypothetical protein [Bacillus sp. EB01]|uniref:hypothetical protein n=1 Tax=Bacillus sp. EB01 TaxID=1347086 RepID=UPI0005C6E62C|nr:hypothetical protein [Bacillus sp. EB01]
MDRLILLMLATIVAGFSLLRLPLIGPIFNPINPIIDFIAIIAILIVSLYLIFLAVKAILNKK